MREPIAGFTTVSRVIRKYENARTLGSGLSIAYDNERPDPKVAYDNERPDPKVLCMITKDLTPKSCAKSCTVNAQKSAVDRPRNRKFLGLGNEGNEGQIPINWKGISPAQSKGQVSHLAKSSKAELVFGNGKTLRMNTPLLFTMSPQVMTCANLSRVLRRSVG